VQLHTLDTHELVNAFNQDYTLFSQQVAAIYLKLRSGSQVSILFQPKVKQPELPSIKGYSDIETTRTPIIFEPSTEREPCFDTVMLHAQESSRLLSIITQTESLHAKQVPKDVLIELLYRSPIIALLKHCDTAANTITYVLNHLEVVKSKVFAQLTNQVTRLAELCSD
jgi:hypothetical protein